MVTCLLVLGDCGSYDGGCFLAIIVVVLVHFSTIGGHTLCGDIVDGLHDRVERQFSCFM